MVCSARNPSATPAVTATAISRAEKSPIRITNSTPETFLPASISRETNRPYVYIVPGPRPKPTSPGIWRVESRVGSRGSRHFIGLPQFSVLVPLGEIPLRRDILRPPQPEMHRLAVRGRRSDAASTADDVSSRTRRGPCAIAHWRNVMGNPASTRTEKRLAIVAIEAQANLRGKGVRRTEPCCVRFGT